MARTEQCLIDVAIERDGAACMGAQPGVGDQCPVDDVVEPGGRLRRLPQTDEHHRRELGADGLGGPHRDHATWRNVTRPHPAPVDRGQVGSVLPGAADRAARALIDNLGDRVDELFTLLKPMTKAVLDGGGYPTSPDALGDTLKG
jgi:hypothetical protein